MIVVDDTRMKELDTRSPIALVPGAAEIDMSGPLMLRFSSLLQIDLRFVMRIPCEIVP